MATRLPFITHSGSQSDKERHFTNDIIMNWFDKNDDDN